MLARGVQIFFEGYQVEFFLRPPRAELTNHGENNIPNMEITCPI